MQGKFRYETRCWSMLSTVLIALFVLSLGTTANAFQLYEKDALTVNLDTTVSLGAKWRVQDRDMDFIHLAHGGTKDSSNGDNGNLNFDTGLISSAAKVTADLEIRSDSFGAFFRGKAFYDWFIMNEDREYVELGDQAEDQAGQDVKLLDAYVWVAHDFGEVPVTLRAGDQVINWGESTFVRNGINAINPIDAGALRVPGSEIREGLLPVGMVWATFAPTINTSIEALYLYQWEQTKPDASGTYFSGNDWATPDGFKVLNEPFPDNMDASVDDTFMAIPRGKSKTADDQGQWGMAFRVYVPALNDTEFGFFYLNYHSRIPVVSSITGTIAGAMTSGAIAGAAQPIMVATGTALAMGAGMNSAIAAGTAAGVAAGAPQAASQQIAGAFVQGGQALATQATKAYSLDAYLRTTNYITEYPEDIQLLGVSFSTQALGWSLRGEVSHRLDVPYQITDTQLLTAAVGAINPKAANNNQIGNYLGQFETSFNGYILSDVTQAQLTLTKKLRPILGTDGGIFAVEAAYNYAHDLPDDIDLKAPNDNLPDDASWGYRARLNVNFFNAIGQINLTPRIAWNHDVHGIGPAPGRSFIKDRKAITFGLKATYQSWVANLSYTNFFGAGVDNSKNDRDFVGLSVKYSF
ncbi:MAG: DUF1302 domain-containing protein [Deltaproteobacteria bacterium]|nr:DUF1302 domain-containing protein [Deltaproteobacteria bacterium]